MNYVIKREKIILLNKFVKIFACNEACIPYKTRIIACTRVLSVIQLFHEKMLLSPIGGTFAVVDRSVAIRL